MLVFSLLTYSLALNLFAGHFEVLVLLKVIQALEAFHGSSQNCRSIRFDDFIFSFCKAIEFY